MLLWAWSYFNGPAGSNEKISIYFQRSILYSTRKRSVYAERDRERGLAAFAKKWSK